MANWRAWWWLALGAGLGCVGPYRPLPIDGPLPSDAFARCAAVLTKAGCGLAVAEREPLRLRTDWYASPTPGCEHRATLCASPDGLLVAVEARWLEVPLLGPPGWSAVRADHAAERDLGARLRAALALSPTGQ